MPFLLDYHPSRSPPAFIPEWTGSPQPPNPRCEREGLYHCGVIICTITDLKPAPAPFTQITLFARLYSPSVFFSGDLTIVSEVVSETDLPRLIQEPGSSTTTEVSFRVSPAITDVPRECIPYWVVVVPVVIGIFALTVIIAVLGCCGLFRRWYNVKKSGPYEETDDGLAYHRRTIPPIPGLDKTGRHDNGSMKEMESVGGDLDKDEEAKAEAEMELEIMTRIAGDDEPDATQPPVSSALTEEQPSPPVGYNFDPSVGVEDEEGMETEL